MKKSLLLSALLFATLATANNYNYEFTPVVGYNITEGSLDIKDHAMYGAEFKYNGFDTILNPELSVLYSRANSENLLPSVEDNVMYRVALNGV